MYRILLATDGSKSMKRLVEEVLTIAVALEAEVHIPAHPDGESGGIRTLNRAIRTPCGWI